MGYRLSANHIFELVSWRLEGGWRVSIFEKVAADAGRWGADHWCFVPDRGNFRKLANSRTRQP